MHCYCGIYSRIQCSSVKGKEIKTRVCVGDSCLKVVSFAAAFWDVTGGSVAWRPKKRLRRRLVWKLNPKKFRFYFIHAPHNDFQEDWSLKMSRMIKNRSNDVSFLEIAEIYSNFQAVYMIRGWRTTFADHARTREHGHCFLNYTKNV